jgi:hypothetical protein
VRDQPQREMFQVELEQMIDLALPAGSVGDAHRLNIV